MSILWMAKTFSGSGICFLWNLTNKSTLPIIETKMLLLPAIRSITDEVYISQQDNAQAHRASQTVEPCFVVRLPNSLLMTCGHPTAWTLIRLIMAFGEWYRNESGYHRPIQDVTWQRRWMSTWVGFHQGCNIWSNIPVAEEMQSLCLGIRGSFRKGCSDIVFACFMTALNGDF